MYNLKEIESYVSPEMSLIVMDSEGVLCGSASHESFSNAVCTVADCHLMSLFLKNPQPMTLGTVLLRQD